MDPTERRDARIEKFLFSHDQGVDIYHHADLQSTATKTFQSKLQSGKYVLHRFPCPVCMNSEEWLLVATSPEGFCWSICQSCGLLQNNVRLPRDNLDEFYESGEYHSICASISGIARKAQFAWNYKASSIIHLDVFDKLGISLSGAHVLDIGCGAGTTLLAMKDRGAVIKGFDLDPEKVAFGKQYVPEIECGNAFDLAGDFSRFDYVTLFGVLEHLFDPREFLVNLRDRIGDSTKVILYVPNLEMCNEYGKSFSDWLHIAHLWYFTPLSLARLLSDVGFQLQSLLPQRYDMTAVCIKASSSSRNSSNSFWASVSAINRCNFQNDGNNSAIRAIRVRDRIIDEAVPFPRRIARRLRRLTRLIPR